VHAEPQAAREEAAAVAVVAAAVAVGAAVVAEVGAAVAARTALQLWICHGPLQGASARHPERFHPHGAVRQLDGGQPLHLPPSRPAASARAQGLGSALP